MDSNSSSNSNGKSDASSSSDDESSASSKKRGKGSSRRKTKRAKPLNLDILHQIFSALNCTKDSDGNYLIRFADLKQNEISAKFFSVTEWQCFRKRIMNHGFDIVDEQQSSWIKARPSIQSPDGRVVFDYPDLRSKYSTPCKIKVARERGELKDVAITEAQGQKVEQTIEDKVTSEFRSNLPSILRNLVLLGEHRIVVEGYEIVMNMKKME